MRNAFFALALVAALFALLMTSPGADAKLRDQTVGVVAANGDGGDAPLPSGGNIYWGG